MRCKITGAPLPDVWKHPGLDGQFVSALTRQEAHYLVKSITGKDLPVWQFSRTGMAARNHRIFSTIEALVDNTISWR